MKNNKLYSFFIGLLLLISVGYIPAHFLFGTLTIPQKSSLESFSKASQLECTLGNLSIWGYLIRSGEMKPSGIVCEGEINSFTPPNFKDNPSKARDTEEFYIRYDKMARQFLQPANLDVEFKIKNHDSFQARTCFLSESKIGWYTCRDSISGCYMKSCQRYPYSLTTEGN